MWFDDWCTAHPWRAAWLEGWLSWTPDPKEKVELVKVNTGCSLQEAADLVMPVYVEGLLQARDSRER